ncbi:MAG: hypothetical protein D6696_02505 [Acidobacteria bacterium]|nr:MAG: hypothetical protein D6696_02505 [Acidobacteriota bacterium]
MSDKPIILSEEDYDIGPDGSVVFSRIEHDDMGVPSATFITEDGDAFSLDPEALETRLKLLEREGRETREERRALEALAGGRG